MPTKSPFWSGSSRWYAASSSSAVSAKIIWRTASTRSSPRNMCSVRHRPMPSAPRARAFADWSGVSAFARTWRRRRSSATAINRSKAIQIFSARASASPARAFSSTDSSRGSSPTKTLPVKPSIVIVSPSLTVVPFAVNERDPRSILIWSAPQTAGIPSPRATTAACEFVPPADVKIPCDAIIPW